jgi:diguanylate cyclase (GGDEF)-like protein
MAAAVGLISVMALITGLWLHSSISRSVKASSIAVATNANANVSARLTREFDAVVAQVHFVGYVAFQSPPKTLSRAQLGQMFTQLVRSTPDLRSLAIINSSHRIFWSYGTLGPSSKLKVLPIPHNEHVAAGHLVANRGHLEQLITYQVRGKNGDILGTVAGEVVLDNPLATNASQTTYIEQTGAPTIAIRANSMAVASPLKSYVPLSVVSRAAPSVTLVSGISPALLDASISHAFFGPLVVLGLAWLLLVGLAIFGAELISMAEANQIRSRRDAEAADLLRSLTRQVLDHDDLHALFVDVCQLLGVATGADQVVTQFSPRDGSPWCVDASGGDGDRVWLNGLTSQQADDHDRRWVEVVVHGVGDVLIWGFGGYGGQGHLMVVNPTPEGRAQVSGVNLRVLDIAVDRADTVIQRNLMAAAVEAIDAGVAIFSRWGSLQWANSVWYALLGADRGVGANCLLTELADGDLAPQIEAYLEEIALNPESRLAIESPFSTGSDSEGFWGSLVLSTVIDERTEVVANIVALLRDATEAHKATQSLAFQLDHDSLTGTLSRAALEAKAVSLISASPALRQPFAIAIIDVDNFKLVNDTWGHAVGDKLLHGLGRRLQECLGASHSVGRFGGDEFVLIFCLSTASVDECANAIERALAQPFVIDGDLNVLVRASMGVARYPGDAKTLDSLLREADRSLYHVKTSKSFGARWWLSRFDLEVSETIEQDPWSSMSAQRLGRYSRAWDALTGVIESRLRDRLDAELPVNSDSHDWVTLHRTLLREVLQVGATPAAMRELLEAKGAELEVASADKDLLSLTSSMVPSAFLDNGVGPVIAGHERRLVLEVVRRRFEWLVEGEREAMTGVRATYLAGAMGASLASYEAWDSFLDATLDTVAGLPAVRGVSFMLSDSHDDGGLRYLGGALTAEMQSWISSAEEATAIFDPSSSTGPGDGALAWENNAIVSVGDALTAQRYRPWRSVIDRLGFRSVSIIPLMAGVQAIGLCVIYGMYTDQFQGRTPEEFLAALQRSLEVGWTRYHSSTGTLTGQRAQRYRKALALGDLREHLQPLLDLRTGTVTRVELLARLEVGDDQLAQPGEFLPAFGPRELSHLFVESLIRATALQEYWSNAGLGLGCSINLPGSVLLDQRLTQVIEAARQQCGGDLTWLTLELLEGEHLAPEANEILRKLARDGIEFAIDDLGSGYSNLDRLVDLPFSQVKLDRSIVQRLWSHPLSTLAIVDGVIQAGHEANRTVVLEGIERLEVLEVARILRADFAQGFLIARPMPAKEVESWLTRFTGLEGLDEPNSIFGGRIGSVLGALAYVWREVHQHGDGLPNDWRDCPVDEYLGRAFGAKSAMVALHRRLHHEGLAISETYHRLTGELDRCQRDLLSGSSISTVVPRDELIAD